MSGRAGRHIDTLKRRRLYLAARVATYRKDGNPSHDKAEIAALTFAIAILEQLRHDGTDLTQVTRRSFVDVSRADD